MTCDEVESRLTQLHREGERTRFSIDISPLGTKSFTVQRITGGCVHLGQSLESAEAALIDANDKVALMDWQYDYERHLVKP